MVKEKEVVEKTKDTAKVDRPAETMKPDKGFFVYLGPIYAGPRDEVETLLKDAIQKYPSIKDLIVSGDTLPEDKIKVRTPGNYLYETYRKLAAGLKQ